MNNPPRPPSPNEIQEGDSNAAIPAGQPTGHVLPPGPGPPAWPRQSGPPNQADHRTQDLHPDRGGFIFTFGFISFFVPVLGLVFGPIAWSMGSTDLKRMRSGTMDISGRGLTQIGYTLGIFTTIIWMITAATLLVIVVAVQFNTRRGYDYAVPAGDIEVSEFDEWEDTTSPEDSMFDPGPSAEFPAWPPAAESPGSARTPAPRGCPRPPASRPRDEAHRGRPSQ